MELDLPVGLTLWVLVLLCWMQQKVVLYLPDLLEGSLGPLGSAENQKSEEETPNSNPSLPFESSQLVLALLSWLRQEEVLVLTLLDVGGLEFLKTLGFLRRQEYLGEAPLCLDLLELAALSMFP